MTANEELNGLDYIKLNHVASVGQSSSLPVYSSVFSCDVVDSPPSLYEIAISRRRAHQIIEVAVTWRREFSQLFSITRWMLLEAPFVSVSETASAADRNIGNSLVLGYSL